MQKGDRAVLRIPKVTLPPEEVHAAREELRYDRDGLPVQKVKDNGSIEEKTFFVDPLGSRLFYSPSFKSMQQSSVTFKSIVEISTAADATPGLKNCLVAGMYPVTVKSGDGKYISVLLADRDKRDRFVQVIAFLVRRCRAGTDEDPRHVRIYDLWVDADRNGRGSLAFYDVQRILQKMNVNMSTAEVDKLFREFDTDKSGTISYGEFVDIYEHLTQVTILKPIFTEFVKEEPEGLMKPGELEVFFREAQGEYVPREMIQQMLTFYTRDENATGLSFGHFSDFVADPLKNGWVFPSMTKVTHAMDRPFHEYFIATSHCTFLTGNQYESDSSADMYAAVLQQGCRAVDVELWDGDNGEPVVGRGGGKHIPLRVVLRAITEAAFTEGNLFPVFIMLETHCCDDQLSVTTRLLDAAFGDALATWEDTAQGTPESLLSKYIVCYKRNANSVDCVKSVAGCSELEGQNAVKEQMRRMGARIVGAGELASHASMAMQEFKRGGGSRAQEPNTAPPRQAIVQVMADVLDEEPVAAAITASASKQLVRVVPDMLRYSDSSNMQLTRFLGMGVSMVSVNYQSLDDAVRISAAFFTQNGGCGYILKPPAQRQSGAGVAAAAAGADRPLLLSITVIAGSQIPRPEGMAVSNNAIVDPYVVLQLGGSVQDMDTNPPLQTKVVFDNGFDPVWNQTFRFVISEPDLATVNVRVMTKDDPVDVEIGYSSVPLSMLRLGYRAVPLRSSFDGTLLTASSLICHFTLEFADDVGGD